jgi:pilus assembly protein TadC
MDPANSTWLSHHVRQLRHRRREESMTYPETADLEREMAPAVTERILAVRAEQGLSLSYAIRTVAADWFRDALAEGFGLDVAQDAARYVHRVGAALLASYRNRSA